jgi:hypothetical protein
MYLLNQESISYLRASAQICLPAYAVWRVASISLRSSAPHVHMNCGSLWLCDFVVQDFEVPILDESN